MKRFLRLEFALPILVLSAALGAFYLHGNSAGGANHAGLRAHITAGIIAYARTSNGRVLASAAQDGSIQIYDEKGEPRKTLKPAGANSSVLPTALALSPDGNRVLTADAQGEVLLRDVDGSNAHRIKLEVESAPGALAFSREKIALGMEDGSLLLLSRSAFRAGKTGVETKSLASGGRSGALRKLLFHPSGDKLVSAGDDDLILVHDLKTGRLAASLRVTGAPVSSLAFDAEGRILFASTEGDGVRVYGPGSQGDFSLRTRVARGREILAVTQAGKTAALATREGPILLYDFDGSAPGDKLISSRAPRVLRGHLKGAVLLSFNQEGLLSAGPDDTMRRWRLDGTPIQGPYLGHADRVRHLAFASKGKVIAAALGGNGVENAAWLWNPAGKLLARHGGHEQDVDCVALSPDAGLLATGSSDNTIRLTRIDKSGKAIGAPRVLRDHARRITRLDFSPDGRFLLSAAADSTLRLRRASTGGTITVLRGHRGTVTRARFSANGRYILSGGGDRTLRLWPLNATGEQARVGPARVFKGHTLGITAAAVSSDGKLIASAAWDRTMRLFNTGDDASRTIQLPERQWIIALSFHPTRELIAGGGWDGGIRLWDFQGRELLRKAEIHGGRVSALAFSPDGKTLATSSYDRTIRLHALKDLLP